MYDEPFALGPSAIHKLDPRLRLAAAVLLAVVLALLKHVLAAGLGLGLALLLLALSRPPLGALCKRLALVNFFVLFIWFTVPFSMPGETLAGFGPLSLSRQGVELALLITLKANAILLLLIALVASMNSSCLGQALGQLGFPRKLVFLLLFTYRYIHVVGAQWGRLRTAAALRGWRANNSLHSYRTIGNMLGMTFVQSFERAARVREAMLLRGFSGQFHALVCFKARGADFAAGAALLAAGCALVLFDLFF